MSQLPEQLPEQFPEHIPDAAPVGVGVVGAGMISRSYARHLGRHPEVRLLACADIDPERAAALAALVPGMRVGEVDALLADPEVEILLNLTRPRDHVAVGLRALATGCHVYSEKPLAVDRAEARRLVTAANASRVRLASAPDTFLSPAFQECRRAIDAGLIGRPVSVTAETLCAGPEWWHPDPAFFYHRGGGPLFDMGPYHLTALVAVLGAVTGVCASATRTWPHRTVTSEPRAGQVIDVEVLTHLCAVLEFAGGVIGTLTTSFDVATERSRLEIHGSEGTLRCPDPSGYDGPVLLRARGATEWTELAGPSSTGSRPPVRRGAGVVDLARALRAGTDHRANGDLAFHVVDVMQSILESARDGRRVPVVSDCRRPEPLADPEPASAGQVCP
ncbi:Gfo/Idh/MocA family protein [Streptoalloteichus hindustanus]|uniref:Predicted dehydrogenase n=1 Tax=Streptoalloteichus hindustanus TaxID=2017 RepID=A0A1M5CVW5_STRHI|nr:Gfo/Idh/MocA family oxidoreductase [Streptoalloteichus hindustanus]SHF58737.1 Predicted dehydrogenase [Streptoalloteichus hindustanus]